jgi:hypothetical protein
VQDAVLSDVVDGDAETAHLPLQVQFAIDPANPYRTLEIRATAEVTDDPGLVFLGRLLAQYGSDLEGFRGPKDDRVVITLNPTRIIETG